MSAFVLKIIAIITMFIDHLGYVIFKGDFSFLNYIGRISFPIIAFQISEGYVHTSNLKKYFFRLFLFALISQIPFMLYSSLVINDFSLNVFFTLFLGLFCIFIYDKCKNKHLGFFVSIIMGIIAHFIHCDYGIYGIMLIFMFYIFRNHNVIKFIFFVIINIIAYLLLNDSPEQFNLIICFIFAMISYLIIMFYNGKKGKDTKHILYIFYPLHLLLLYGISLFL